jgi:DNA-directed RNA polymerase specialized sigma24 family protein
LRLSDEARALAARNTGLAYWAAYQLGLTFPSVPYDDRLSLCFEALCQAVLTHDPRRAQLSTWIFRRSYQAVLNHLSRGRTERKYQRRYWRLRHQVRRRPGTEPLEAMALRDEAHWALRMAQEVATPTQRRILAELAEGGLLSDVAVRMGCRPQSVGQQLADLRRRVLPALRRRQARFEGYQTEHP